MSLHLDETHRTIHVPEELRADPSVPEYVCRRANTCVYADVQREAPARACGMPRSLRNLLGVVYYSQWADDATLESVIAWHRGSPFPEILNEGLATLHVAVGWGGYYVEMRPEAARPASDSQTSVQRATVPGMAEQVDGEG